MPRQTSARVFSQAFKVAAVERILAGERVRQVAAELTIKRQILYRWWSAYEREGAAGLARPSGRPAGTAAGRTPPPRARRRSAPDGQAAVPRGGPHRGTGAHSGRAGGEAR